MKNTIIVLATIFAIASYNALAEGISITNLLATIITSNAATTFEISGTNDAGLVGGAEIRQSFPSGTNLYKFGVDTTGWFWTATLNYGTNVFIAYGTNTANIATAYTGIVIRAGVANADIFLYQKIWVGGNNGTVYGTNNIYCYGGLTVTNVSAPKNTYSDKTPVISNAWNKTLYLKLGTNMIVVIATNIFGESWITTNLVVGFVDSLRNYNGQGYLCLAGIIGTSWKKISCGIQNSSSLDTNATHVVPFLVHSVIASSFHGETSTLYFSTSTNTAFYGWGVGAKGATNQFTTTISPYSIFEDTSLKLDGDFYEMWIKGSAEGTTYQLMLGQ